MTNTVHKRNHSLKGLLNLWKCNWQFGLLMVQERRVHQFLVIWNNHTKQKKCSSIAVVFNSVNYRHRGKHKAGLFSGLRYLFSSNTALSTDRSNVAMQRRHFKAVYLFYSQQKQKKLHSSSFYSSMDLQLSGAPAGHMFTHSRSSFWVDSLIICMDDRSKGHHFHTETY